MGGSLRVAGGLAALLLIGSPGAAMAGVRVVEGERMKAVSGQVVRAAEAGGGRALALRPRGSASTRLTSGAVTSFLLRARVRRCGTVRRLSVTVDGGAPRVIRLKPRWREQRVGLSLAAGRHRIRVAFPGRRGGRCRALVDRLRLPAAKRPAPAPAPAPPPPPAAAPEVPQPLRVVPLGASVQHQYMVKDPAFEQALRREFVSFTPENELKMSWIHPEKGQWNFEAADALVKFAVDHGMAVRGHALVFGAQTPPWVRRALLPGDADAALRDHILTVVGRYKHHVREWDVVNEALDHNGNYRQNPWMERLGRDYVVKAFRIAREADPTAKLFYNEFGADTMGVKRDATVNLVHGLKAEGLIDGVGLQMHRSLADAPMREQVEETMRIYESMGLEVQVTEMDVLAGGEDPLTDRLTIQADAYRRVAEACAAVVACTRFTVWGVTDKYSWMGVDQLPLLLDNDYAPKPALTAVRSVLGR